MILSVGPVTLAKAPEQPPAEQAPADVPACKCCYYSQSQQLDPDKDPGLRTCGWFWDEHRESWVWWHGQAPHAPFPYPQGDMNEDLMSLRQDLLKILLHEPGGP